VRLGYPEGEPTSAELTKFMTRKLGVIGLAVMVRTLPNIEAQWFPDVIYNAPENCAFMHLRAGND